MDEDTDGQKMDDGNQVFIFLKSYESYTYSLSGTQGC